MDGAIKALKVLLDAPVVHGVNDESAVLLSMMGEVTRMLSSDNPFEHMTLTPGEAAEGEPSSLADLPTELLVRMLQWSDVRDLAHFEAVSRSAITAVAHTVRESWMGLSPSSALPERRFRPRCVMLNVQESWASLHRFITARKLEYRQRSIAAISGWDPDEEADEISNTNFTLQLSKLAGGEQHIEVCGFAADTVGERPQALLNAIGPTFSESQNVAAVAAGAGHIVVLTTAGQVFTLGDGGRGQCGHGDLENILQLKEVAALTHLRITRIAAGNRYTFVTSDDGLLLSFGFGGTFRLGHGDTESVLLPLAVKALQGKLVASSFCGWNHSAAVTCDGELYTWGDGSRGQLGSSSIDSRPLPQLVDGLVRVHVTAVCCGGMHTAAVSASGAIWTWGNGDSGRLGHGNEEDQLAPKLVETLANCRVVCISASLYTTHAVVDSGHLYTWGYGGDGALGHGDEQNQPLPRLVENQRSVVAITSGWHHTAILTNDGALFTAGDAGDGKAQLCFDRAEIMSADNLSEMQVT